MVTEKSKSTTSKDNKFLKIRDIIMYYDEGEKQVHKHIKNWYGNTFEKLLSYPNGRLNSLHMFVKKKGTNEET